MKKYVSKYCLYLAGSLVQPETEIELTGEQALAYAGYVEELAVPAKQAKPAKQTVAAAEE